MKRYIEVEEGLKGSDRYIKSITVDGRTFYPAASYFIGGSEYEGRNCLVNMCMFGKKRLDVYLEEKRGEIKYFIIK